MSEEISKNVKVPEFVNAITADFTTTSPTMKMVSQISIMSSLQQYFCYGMTTYCGIPAIEMLGSENDWVRLGEKLQALRKTLEPITDQIGLDHHWWSHVEKVFRELLETYRGFYYLLTSPVFIKHINHKPFDGRFISDTIGREHVGGGLNRVELISAPLGGACWWGLNRVRLISDTFGKGMLEGANGERASVILLQPSSQSHNQYK